MHRGKFWQNAYEKGDSPYADLIDLSTDPFYFGSIADDSHFFTRGDYHLETCFYAHEQNPFMPLLIIF